MPIQIAPKAIQAAGDGTSNGGRTMRIGAQTRSPAIGQSPATASASPTRIVPMPAAVEATATGAP